MNKNIILTICSAFGLSGIQAPKCAEDNTTPVHITINGFGGPLFTVEAHSDWSMLQVMEVIAEKAGHPVEFQSLLKGTNELSPYATVASLTDSEHLDLTLVVTKMDILEEYTKQEILPLLPKHPREKSCCRLQPSDEHFILNIQFTVLFKICISKLLPKSVQLKLFQLSSKVLQNYAEAPDADYMDEVTEWIKEHHRTSRPSARWDCAEFTEKGFLIFGPAGFLVIKHEDHDILCTGASNAPYKIRTTISHHLIDALDAILTILETDFPTVH